MGSDRRLDQKAALQPCWGVVHFPSVQQGLELVALAHPLLQLPQCVGSVLVSTHLPAQQVSPELHAWPQVPQLLLSLVRS